MKGSLNGFIIGIIIFIFSLALILFVPDFLSGKPQIQQDLIIYVVIFIGMIAPILGWLDK